MSQALSVLAKSKIKELHKFTALAYGGEVGETYAATPSIAQTLNDKIIEDGNWFLRMINVVPVSEMTGEKVFLGLSGNVSGRTDTSGSGERSAKNLVDLTDEDYALKRPTLMSRYVMPRLMPGQNSKTLLSVITKQYAKRLVMIV